MHPGYLSKDVVGPSGPVDPQLSVISIQTKDGKPLTDLANYSQHYFGQSPVSADYFGLFNDIIAKRIGGDDKFVCAMSKAPAVTRCGWTTARRKRTSPSRNTAKPSPTTR